MRAAPGHRRGPVPRGPARGPGPGPGGAGRRAGPAAARRGPAARAQPAQHGRHRQHRRAALHPDPGRPPGRRLGRRPHRGAHRRPLRLRAAPVQGAARPWPAEHPGAPAGPGPGRGDPGLHRRHRRAASPPPWAAAAATSARPCSARPWAPSDIQIWTDVEGVLTCDPRVVPEAQPIAELSFAEAAELAAFGAKVLHPATIQPAVEAGIPVTVRHTRRPHGRFTTITAEVRTGRPITALAQRGPITVLTVTSAHMLNQSGFLASLFQVFSRHKISVDLIATAEVSVSLTVDADAPAGGPAGGPGGLRHRGRRPGPGHRRHRRRAAQAHPRGDRALLRRPARHQRRDDQHGRQRDQPELRGQAGGRQGRPARPARRPHRRAPARSAAAR